VLSLGLGFFYGLPPPLKIFYRHLWLPAAYYTFLLTGTLETVWKFSSNWNPTFRNHDNFSWFLR